LLSPRLERNIRQAKKTVIQSEIHLNRPAQILRRFLAILVILVGVPLVCAGQTFKACTLIDTVPLDGIADVLLIPNFTIGELNGTSEPYRGLSRARLAVQLPPIPSGTKFATATLRLYLQGNSSNAGNASFGPLSLYHNFKPNFLEFRDTDYADTNYVLVTNSVVDPASPTGQYYEMDVSVQVAKDFASDGATPISDFRFQVDGLQYVGGYHCYDFDSVGSHPPQLLLLWAGPAVPITPLLSMDFPGASSTLSLTWPTNFSGFVLESASIPTAQTWNAVTNLPVIHLDQFQVGVQTSETQRFFRLHLP
jgi:hypothetical protein